MVAGKAMADVPMINGIAYDLKDDPKAGRDELMLHRPGQWTGEIFVAKAGESGTLCRPVREQVSLEGNRLVSRWNGSAFMADDVFDLIKV